MDRDTLGLGFFLTPPNLLRVKKIQPNYKKNKIVTLKKQHNPTCKGGFQLAKLVKSLMVE